MLLNSLAVPTYHLYSVVSLSRPPTISSSSSYISSSRYEQPQMRLKYGQRCFSYAAPAVWNTLSPSLQQLTKTDSFKRQLKTVLFERAFSFTCQLISIIITTLIIHHSFTLSLQAQNLPFQQIRPTLDFFYLPDCLHDSGTGPDLSCSSFYF